jgi:multidrug efflux system membrane fusion protein
MVENAQAAIRSDEAMVDTAKLQLGYTSIAAPMDGRTGNLLVQAGNVVKSNGGHPLVVIAQGAPHLRLVSPFPSSTSPPLKQFRAARNAEDRGAAGWRQAERGRRRDLR